jgi:hypothetical protein
MKLRKFRELRRGIKMTKLKYLKPLEFVTNIQGR